MRSEDRDELLACRQVYLRIDGAQVGDGFGAVCLTFVGIVPRYQ